MRHYFVIYLRQGFLVICVLWPLSSTRSVTPSHPALDSACMGAVGIAGVAQVSAGPTEATLFHLFARFFPWSSSSMATMLGDDEGGVIPMGEGRGARLRMAAHGAALVANGAAKVAGVELGFNLSKA